LSGCPMQNKNQEEQNTAHLQIELWQVSDPSVMINKDVMSSVA